MALNLSVPPTKLLVRMHPDASGRVMPLLADAAGDPLPMQRQVSLSFDHKGLAEVTVTFAVDGDAVRLVPDRLEPGV